MPSVDSLEALTAAVSQFPGTELSLDVSPAAREAAGRSLAGSGLLLLGEMHGVRENPLLIQALMAEFGLTSLALEWPDQLTPVISAFLSTGTLTDHDFLWFGDGRVTAGHLAVLASMAAAGPLSLVLFDGFVASGGWTERDEAMARRLLAGIPSGGRTLVVAGNAHTPTRPTELGVPLGAQLARRRPGITGIRIRYRSGSFWNCGPRQFGGGRGPGGSGPGGPGTGGSGTGDPGAGGRPRLIEHDGELILDLPQATEATVPQRPLRTQRPGGR